jgi:hypothetical protein
MKFSVLEKSLMQIHLKKYSLYVLLVFSSVSKKYFKNVFFWYLILLNALISLILQIANSAELYVRFFLSILLWVSYFNFKIKTISRLNTCCAIILLFLQLWLLIILNNHDNNIKYISKIDI